MDRGEVVKIVQTAYTTIQICQYDLQDEGGGTVFLRARPRWPADYTDNPTWPEVAGVEELDELIAALQEQRAWLAEPDPAKRWLMTPGHTIDADGTFCS